MVETLISWEEAIWTMECLGLSVSKFARLLGVRPQLVHQGRLHPQMLLSHSSAMLLRLEVNRIRQDDLGRWALRVG